MPLEFHPYADIFPLPSTAEREAQREDIRENGVIEPIEVFEGKILDGRSRYLDLVELKEAGAVLGKGWGVWAETKLSDEELQAGSGMWWFRQFLPEEQGDPLTYVISKNVHRRHLTTSQRAYAMAEAETLRHGGPRKPAEWQDANLRLDPDTRADLAEKAHVSERSINSGAVVRDHGVEELKTAVKQGAITVSDAEKIAKRPEEEQQQELQRRGLAAGPSPHMPNRVEPPESLDYSPTPPWATRALMDVVVPYVGIWPDDLAAATCHEPACGEGHMSAVLEEYFGDVSASDIFDYSVDGRSPPGWEGVCDFLAPEVSRPGAHFIISNPPFRDKLLPFIVAALDRAEIGVAMFVQLRHLEGIDRYEKIFRDRPPTAVAFFVERVPLHMGRWEPDGGTMTAYVWLVWVKGRSPMPPLWIPPGQRERLTKPDDRERFTAHPVLPKGVMLEGEKYDASTGEIEESEDGRSVGKQPEAAERERAADHVADLQESDGTAGRDRKHRSKPGGIAGADENSRSDDVGSGGTAHATHTAEDLAKTKDGIPLYLLRDREKMATP